MANKFSRFIPRLQHPINLTAIFCSLIYKTLPVENFPAKKIRNDSNQYLSHDINKQETCNAQEEEENLNKI